MEWLLTATAAWVLCSIPGGMLMGRALRSTRRSTTISCDVPDHIPPDVVASVDLRWPHRTL